LGERLVNSGQPEAGLKLLLEGQRLVEGLTREHSRNTQYQTELAASQRGLAFAYRDLGEDAKARSYFEKARTLQEKLVRAQPSVVGFQSELASTWFGLALFEAARRRPEEALYAYQKCRELRARLVEVDSETLDHRHSLAQTLNNLGLLLGDLGQSREGIT